MYFDLDAQSFAQEMLLIRNNYWNSENEKKRTELGLTKAEVVTLASIVYSEQSRQSEEWPIIARLYLNRLERNQELQSDPTFKFCWGDELKGVEKLTFKHRDIDCPYNTYKIVGLPPGPICMVQSEVLDAVLNAKKHDFIFMMAKPGGKGHNFSETYSQHKLYVKEYRKWEKDYLKGK